MSVPIAITQTLPAAVVKFVDKTPTSALVNKWELLGQLPEEQVSSFEQVARKLAQDEFADMVSACEAASKPDPSAREASPKPDTDEKQVRRKQKWR